MTTSTLEEEEGGSGISQLPVRHKTCLPDEQDRKRIVGCLAAILAFSYAYDVEEKTSTPPSPTPYYAESTYSMSFSEQSDAEMTNSSMHSNATAASQESSCAHPESPKVEEELPKQQNTSPDPKKQQWTKMLSRKQAHKETIAKERHRRRRHEIYLNLLQSCADLLFLDKSHAQAFSPMLGRLLNPPPPSPKTIKEKKEMKTLDKNTPPRNTNPKEQPEEEVAVDTPSSSTLKESELVEITKNDSTSTENGSPKPTPTSFFPPTTSPKNEAVENKKQEDASNHNTVDDMHNNEALMEIINPFLDSLTPGAGFRCVTLLLLHHLLTSPNGYDSRVRHAFKKLAILVIYHESKHCDVGKESQNQEEEEEEEEPSRYEKAARKFEALEHAIAEKLLALPALPTDGKNSSGGESSGGRGAESLAKTQSSNNVVRQQIIRGLKIGSAGLVAGTLFAFTGGLAAPAIAAGVAAISSTAAATTAVIMLTSTTAITAIFGVGGGGIAAYKMHRRSKGLTEFDFQKESKGRAELYSTICLSGWLRDKQDFQRPWGVKPTKPPIASIQELLERFYFVYKRENVFRCTKILQQWKGEERELWRLLRLKYGRDPEHLYPFTKGPREDAALTEKEDQIVNSFMEELGLVSPPSKNKPILNLARKIAKGAKSSATNTVEKNHPEEKKGDESGSTTTHDKDPLKVPPMSCCAGNPPASPASTTISTFSCASTTTPDTNTTPLANNAPPPLPTHLATVWDFQSEYTGELYTVKWESKLILELCDSVTDLAVDIVGAGTREILKHTAITTLITAVALPAALLNVSNIIDETWSLAIQRAEEAGIELANCLLENSAGHRPVNLVGFSMGARIIYACLKELARHQERWEEQRSNRLNSKHTDGNESSSQNNNGASKNNDIVVYHREPASVIEDVILMGMPNHLSIPSWIACRRIIAGRLINCYSKKDLILSIMFQYKRMSGILRPVCGTSAVDVPGVENYDVSSFIASHSDYCLAVNDILKLVKYGQPRISVYLDGADMVDTVKGEEEEEEIEEEKEESTEAEGSEVDGVHSF